MAVCHTCDGPLDQSAHTFCSIMCYNIYQRNYTVLLDAALTLYRASHPAAQLSEVDERTAALDYYREGGRTFKTAMTDAYAAAAKKLAATQSAKAVAA
jgi:hypothetical protein